MSESLFEVKPVHITAGYGPLLLKVLSLVSLAIFAAIALVHWRRSHIDPRKPLGLLLDRKTGVEFGVGVLIGALAMLGIFSTDSLLGLVRVNGFELRGHHILQSSSSYLLTGFIEELTCRGLLLSGLIIVVRRRWLGVALMAAIFGFLHAANPHATALSVLGNALGGVVYAAAYLGSRRLWLGTGIHFAWNLVQGPVLGFPVSGGVIPWGGLLTESIGGPDWLSGGPYGPEGGLICIGFRFIAVGLVAFWLVVRMRS